MEFRSWAKGPHPPHFENSILTASRCLTLSIGIVVSEIVFSSFESLRKAFISALAGKSRGSPPCNELRDPCFPSRDENLPSHGTPRKRIRLDQFRLWKFRSSHKYFNGVDSVSRHGNRYHQLLSILNAIFRSLITFWDDNYEYFEAYEQEPEYSPELYEAALSRENDAQQEDLSNQLEKKETLA
ncbi:hypothetical protein Q3G72_020037 [Acer saccharum]|nr:hypothetical protein Q3G72_020037 [Acer saccharum]